MTTPTIEEMTPEKIADIITEHHWPPPTLWIVDTLNGIRSAWLADRAALASALEQLEEAKRERDEALRELRAIT